MGSTLGPARQRRHTRPAHRRNGICLGSPAWGVGVARAEKGCDIFSSAFASRQALRPLPMSCMHAFVCVIEGDRFKDLYENVPSIASTGTPHFVFTSGPGAATPQYCL